ncbi:MAG: hypothetical protein Q7S74_02475 [Nanoarchaeota archaeon]|nr:hypothetical protein [Nanoarchaeota archaeon]
MVIEVDSAVRQQRRDKKYWENRIREFVVGDSEWDMFTESKITDKDDLLHDFRRRIISNIAYRASMNDFRLNLSLRDVEIEYYRKPFLVWIGDFKAKKLASERDSTYSLEVRELAEATILFSSSCNKSYMRTSNIENTKLIENDRLAEELYFLVDRKMKNIFRASLDCS